MHCAVFCIYSLSLQLCLSIQTHVFFLQSAQENFFFLHKEETKNSKIKFKKILNSQKGSNQSPSLSNLDIRVLTEYVQKKVQLWGKSQ